MQAPAHSRTSFRPDIEGMRALAVLLILMAHSSIRGFSGGYIGVDVFFVISGYLITGIMIREMDAGTFSFATFYRRRIVRLFPALFAVLAATTVAAWAVMVPSELVSYAKSLVAAVFFSSNIFFDLDAGYFTASAATRPLIHTWSLAIEEQFYIFWPLLLLGAARMGRPAILTALIALVAVSLSLAAWMVTVRMQAAFYLIPFRAWEFAVGGLVAMLPRLSLAPAWLRQLMGIAGTLIILICANRYRELTTPFPGLAAVPPCLATAMLILAGPESLAGRALSLPPVRFIGRISYSLYLWHWPVIVVTRLALFPMYDPGVIAVDIALSILLGWLSYRYIEQGGRKLLDRLKTRAALFAGLAMMLAGGAVGAVIMAAHGFPERYSTQKLRIASVLEGDEQKAYRIGSCFVAEPGDRFDAAQCLGRTGGKPSLLLVGDSLAAHYWPGLSRHADSLDILQATMAGCPPQLPAQAKLPCQKFFAGILLKWAAENRPDAVLLAGNWQQNDVSAIGKTLSRLSDARIRVILVGPMPRYDTSLARLLFFAGKSERSRIAAQHLDPGIWAIDKAMRAEAMRNGASYISPTSLLCRARRCALFTADGIPLQFDDVHLTRQGSEMLATRMMPQIRQAIAASEAQRD